MNTLEWMPIFLPSLWLFAIYISDADRRRLGLVWIAGRILYMTGYSQAADKRGPGFAHSGAAAIGILWLGALGAIVWRLIHRTEANKRRALRQRGVSLTQNNSLRSNAQRLTSSAGSRCPWRTGTPCRRARRRAACNNPRASSIPTAS